LRPLSSSMRVACTKVMHSLSTFPSIRLHGDDAITCV
jgi:hypothetical protein